ncbi:MAG: hypothetical protein JXB88_26200 [Spirochaetales bacterium]|nr:hypothetical protein [Spirochaetales bacterium]
MTITYCDVTKKPIEGGTTSYSWEIRNYRYDTVLDKDLSPDGMATLEDEVRKEMGAKTEFNFMEHKRVLKEKLNELTQ